MVVMRPITAPLPLPAVNHKAPSGTGGEAVPDWSANQSRSQLILRYRAVGRHLIGIGRNALTVVGIRVADEPDRPVGPFHHNC